MRAPNPFPSLETELEQERTSRKKTFYHSIDNLFHHSLLVLGILLQYFLQLLLSQLVPPPLIVGGRWCISIHWWNSSTNCCCCYDCSNALKLLYSFPSFSGSDRGEMNDVAQFNLFFYELLLIFFYVKVKIKIDLKYFYCLFGYRPIETSYQNWKKKSFSSLS